MSFNLGHAHVMLVKSAADKPTTVHSLSGELQLSKSGWILLHVPNDLVRGAFAALDEPGAELPSHNTGDRLNAHISVIRPEELEEAGLTGNDVKERGKQFTYTLGPVQSVTPHGWSEMSKVWFIKVNSPELRKLRRSYGLTSLPKDGEHDFHITIAVRRKNVLQTNSVSKAASLIHDGPQRWFEKLAGPAAGIPSRSNYGDLSQLKPGLIDFIIQHHLADRAGPHYDVRFGSPDTGLFSWATKHKLPEPGNRRALFQQPLHSHEYGDFEGEIPEGYGKGTVRKERQGKILLRHVSPTKIEFTTADQRYPERFAMVRPEGWKDQDWLLINTTPRDRVPYEKVHYKKIPADKVDSVIDQMQEGETLEAKIDGASSLIQLLKDGVELVSYRTSKETGRPIVHTERFFGGPGNKMNIPPELVGTVLKGELYGVRQPVPTTADSGGDRGVSDADGEEVQIGPQDLGGILNASVANALQAQKAKGVQLKNMVYDIQRLGKQDVDWHETPRTERRKMIEQVLKHLPQDKFHISEAASSQDEARQLWQRIKQRGYSPATEGVVYWPLHGTPSKSKLLEDHDVYVTGTYPGRNRLAGVGVGGLTYATEPGGETVGRIGTGLSDELRRELFRNSDQYVGRTARIQSQQQFPSGAYRAPALIGLHEDYPAKAASLIHGDDLDGYFDRSGNGLCKRSTDLPGVGGEPGADEELQRGRLPQRGGGGDVAGVAASDQGPDEADQAFPRNGEILSILKKVKDRSRLGDYAYKYQMLRQLMQQMPDAFIVDDPTGKYHGITHVPTGYRYHLPPAAFQDLIKTSSDDHVTTVAVDLDGTLAKYDGWKGEDHIGDPRPGAKKMMEEFQAKGWRLIVFTTRGNNGRVKEWLQEHDIPFDYINENPDQPEGSSGKVIADAYVDDRAVRASGRLSDAKQQVFSVLKAASLGYAVQDSEIHGKGTFATRDYEPGDRVGRALEFVRQQDDGVTEYDRTMLGRFVNYQDEGNVTLREDVNGHLDLYATEPIASGEEMYTQPYEKDLKRWQPLQINGGYKQAFDMSGSWYGEAAQDYMNNILAGRQPVWDPQMTIWQNLGQHFGNVRDIGSQRIQQAETWDRFQNAMDPDRSMRQLSNYLSGRERPIVRHPVDAILHGRFGGGGFT